MKQSKQVKFGFEICAERMMTVLRHNLRILGLWILFGAILLLLSTSSVMAEEGGGPTFTEAALNAPTCSIDAKPEATCDGWSIEMDGESSQALEWHAKVDGSVIDSGYTNGNETITGDWPGSVDLSQWHTFRAGIKDNDGWHNDSVDFGNCPQPNIALTKTPNITTAVLGDTIIYTYVVKNTGALTLYQVSLVDDKLGDVQLEDATLDPDETTTGTVSYVVQVGDVPSTIYNEAVVTGNTQSGTEVEATDDATVIVIVAPELETDKTVTPGVCEEAQIDLVINGAGMQGEERIPLDLVLVLDRSGSMEGQPLADLKTAAKLLIDELDSSIDRIGLVSYADWASVGSQLTDDFGAVKTAIGGMNADGYTNIGDGVFDAKAELDARGRPGALPLLLVMSDGVANRSHGGATGCSDWPASANTCTNDAINQAAAAKAAGITVYTVGLNLDGVEANHSGSGVLARSVLQTMASGPNQYYEAPTSGDLSGIFQDIAYHVINIAGTDIVVTEILPTGVHYVPNSASPAPFDVSGQTLVWKFDEMGIDDTETISFSIVLDDLTANQLVDVYPDSRTDYLDFRGNPASIPFPETRMTPVGCPVIGDYVWHDSNGDGIQDSGESGFDDVTLALWTAVGNNPGSVIDTTVTANNGVYHFDPVFPGIYFVEVTDDNGVVAAYQPTSGPESKISPFGPITVVGYQVYDEADFGYNTCEPKLRGYVWRDMNLNGQRDRGETGIANIEVALLEMHQIIRWWT